MVTLDDFLFALRFFSALGCALMAGLFFAFSVIVMRALARLPAAEGIAAMQSINLAVANPLFWAAFFGTPAACLLVIVSSLWRWHEPRAVYLVIGSALYLAGSFLVTVVFNVPRNEALAAVTPTAPASATLWTSYQASWTAWNHVRTIASLAAAASLTYALCH